jgi:hypothetical protein
MKCKSCNRSISNANAEFCPWCKAPLPVDIDGPWWNPDMLPSSDNMYKVVTLKDRYFGGKFDPALLQSALNDYASEGWRLKEAVTADIPGIGIVGGSRNEIIFVLERANLEQNLLNEGLKISHGVLFVGDDVPSLTTMGEISESISQQNASLMRLRELMAYRARDLGANTIYRFQNSQSAHGPMKLLNPIRWDTESLSGRGELAFVEPAEMESFIAAVSKLELDG